MPLESGFYWVRPKGGLEDDWIVAQREEDVGDDSDTWWWFIGSNEPLVTDEELLEHYELGPRVVFPLSYVPEDV